MRPALGRIARDWPGAVPTLAAGAGLLLFGLWAPRFLTAENLVNILVQSSAVAIVATGMTFVLLTGGIDLSVGSIMFLGAVAAGKLALGGAPVWLALLVIPPVGLLAGAVNLVLVTRLRILAFVATLATLSIGRGLGLYITQTRAMNLPDEFLRVGSARVGGVPMPIVTMALVLAAAHVVLSRTALGRQVYAVGHDAEAAEKAGINVRAVVGFTFLASASCAAIGGLVLLVQLAAVSSTLGERWEFEAIAAAVLGGTSLYGGKGRVLPGTLAGALLIQTIRNGLNVANADPYLYPVVLGAVVFLAVLLDRVRSTRLRKRQRRTIRPAGT
jgi:ribose/xylose/arabinose/galactoside ABC-type transport system permease subunit